MLNETAQYLRRVASSDPVFNRSARIGSSVHVVNIEHFSASQGAESGDHGSLVLDLDDGTSVRLDYFRYQRDAHDEAAVQRAVEKAYNG